MTEEWKDIPEYEGYYQISNLGRVKSLARSYTCSLGHTRKLKERIMKLVPNTGGYLEFSCCKNSKYKRFIVSRLVGKLFIPNPYNLPEINHIDGDKTNNKVSNLEWTTRSKNIYHAYNTGLKFQYQGEDNHLSKLTKSEVIEILALLKEGHYNQRQIGELYNVSYSNISKIKLKKIWKGVDNK